MTGHPPDPAVAPRRAGQARNPWLAIDSGVDPVRLARLLGRAHELALRRQKIPTMLRPVVSSSWGRAVAEGVDPDGYAPMILGAAETKRALARNPLSRHLGIVEKMVAEAAEDSECLVALSDEAGVLLWADGHPRALEIAARPGFLPGHLCSEQAMGTNAIGTALALNHAVQIFSAEHYNRRLHELTCAAAPIHDPDDGRTVGVLNLSGGFRTGHPHSLALVTAAAQVIESSLRSDRAQRDEELRGLFLERLQKADGRRAIVTASGRVLAASPRGWLGPRLRLGADGHPLAPAGAIVEPEPIDRRGDAYLVRAAQRPRRTAPPPTVEVNPLEGGIVEVRLGGWTAELSRRHSRLVALLALHPAGLSAEQLRAMAYGGEGSLVTVRAEISRLRRVLGPIVNGNPYRIDGRVETDVAGLRASLREPAPVPATQPLATPGGGMTAATPTTSFAHTNPTRRILDG